MKNHRNHIKPSSPHCPCCSIFFTALHIASSPHPNAPFIIRLRMSSQLSSPCPIQLLRSTLNTLSWWLGIAFGLSAGIHSTPAWSSHRSLTAIRHALSPSKPLGVVSGAAWSVMEGKDWGSAWSSVRDAAEGTLGACMGNGAETIEGFMAAVSLKNAWSSPFCFSLGFHQAWAFLLHSTWQAFEPQWISRF